MYRLFLQMYKDTQQSCEGNLKGKRKPERHHDTCMVREGGVREVGPECGDIKGNSKGNICPYPLSDVYPYRYSEKDWP